MRLTLADLDEALLDPEEFVEQRRVSTGGKRPKGRYNRPQARRDIALNWHLGRITEAEARAQFVKKCLEYESDSKLLVAELDTYFENHRDSPSKTKQVRRSVDIALPGVIDPRFSIGTKIDRLDRNSDGTYTAVLMAAERRNWSRGFRLPVIQLSVAAKYNRPLSEVDVTVYCFDDGNEYRYQFTQDDVDAALEDMRQLLVRLEPLVASETLPPGSNQTSFTF
jgi:hypothetical protein